MQKYDHVQSRFMEAKKVQPSSTFVYGSKPASPAKVVVVPAQVAAAVISAPNPIGEPEAVAEGGIHGGITGTEATALGHAAGTSPASSLSQQQQQQQQSEDERGQKQVAGFQTWGAARAAGA
jgi:hypothetical protein